MPAGMEIIIYIWQLMEYMVKALKIRLKPTKEQEILMFKSAGAARFNTVTIKKYRT
jgi:Helix-turn-helix domain